MKRSEQLQFLDLSDDLRSRGAARWPETPEELERAYGEDQAYESSSDEIRWILDDVVVDEEDVDLCESTIVYPEVKRARVHEVGSKPFRVFLGTERGCRECADYVEYQAKT